jgi:hypothetical protein
MDQWVDLLLAGIGVLALERRTFPFPSFIRLRGVKEGK